MRSVHRPKNFFVYRGRRNLFLLPFWKLYPIGRGRECKSLQIIEAAIAPGTARVKSSRCHILSSQIQNVVQLIYRGTVPHIKTVQSGHKFHERLNALIRSAPARCQVKEELAGTRISDKATQNHMETKGLA